MSEVDVLPAWADDVETLREFIINAHGRASNIPTEGAAGGSVHIGLIDSAWRLPDQLTEGYTVHQHQKNAFIDTAQHETTHHCTPVFCFASAYCPNATYSLYQAVNEEGELPIGAFSDAITAAIEDGVDILNISAGDPWPGPTATNPNIHEIKRAIEEEIIVVSAAGNWKGGQDTRPPVHCPAAYEDVIAVGGFVSECPAEIGEEPANRRQGPYYIEKGPRLDYEERIPEGPFCGERGCTNGEGCIPNKFEKEWEYNVMSTGEKPDVLAPVLVPEYSDGKHFLNSGTSFGAPIVTGSLGCILDELHHSRNHALNAYQARKAVVDGASPIDEGKLPKFDAMGTREVLGLL